jgi:hypothetical protein
VVSREKKRVPRPGNITRSAGGSNEKKEKLPKLAQLLAKKKKKIIDKIRTYGDRYRI